MDFIEFEEAGLSFEVQGPFSDGGYLTLVRSPDAEPRTHGSESFAEVGRLVDRLVAARPPEAREGGFPGFDMEIWDHEGGVVRRARYPTRGSILQWFDDGSLPSAAEAADLAELCGNVVLEVRDRDGRMLLDVRDEAEARIAALGNGWSGP
jgi:hypothetical protein